MEVVNEAKIATLKSRRRAAINELQSLEKRRQEIQKVYDKSFKMDDYANNIDSKLNKCMDDISDGIRGLASVSRINSTINELKEKKPLSLQSNFDSAISHMNQELSRLDARIRECEAQKASCEKQIRAEGGHIMLWD